MNKQTSGELKKKYVNCVLFHSQWTSKMSVDKNEQRVKGGAGGIKLSLFVLYEEVQQFEQITYRRNFTL